MDFELSDEQQLIRETARDFTDHEIVERARENDRNEHFDLELVAKIAQQGYLGAIVPREYGGAGLDYLTYGLVVEQVGRGCSAMRTVISVQTSLVCSSILRWGTEEQKHHYLPKLCSGEWLGCRGLACFLVDTDQDGFQPQTIHHKMGLRGSDTAAISLDDVWAPEDAVLGEVGDGFKVAMTALDSGRYSVAAGCVGICQGCVDASVRYSKEREQFGRPIGSFQLVQAMISNMVLETDAARMLVWRAGWLKDAGKPNTTETSIAKLYATEAAVRCANTGIQVHGGSGYVDDYPVERYFRDVRVTTLYEGTSQIQQLIIGRAVTGINALT
ncbi:MAG: acyl-CoA dehydrogenase [Actinobacteria bacterium]|nr:MAG: acyl-CoA dehydrogenase [Actinomycetota bacterium]